MLRTSSNLVQLTETEREALTARVRAHRGAVVCALPAEAVDQHRRDAGAGRDVDEVVDGIEERAPRRHVEVVEDEVTALRTRLVDARDPHCAARPGVAAAC
jgi:hypothetical protein